VATFYTEIHAGFHMTIEVSYTTFKKGRDRCPSSVTTLYAPPPSCNMLLGTLFPLHLNF